jgi:hypothetical protein
MNISQLRYKVSLGKTVPYWWRFAYLIPDIFDKHPDLGDDFSKVIQGQDNGFVAYVNKYVEAYLDNGAMPPAAIVGPIMNLAEDIKAGREAVMRVGDYMAIRNEMHAKK